MTKTYIDELAEEIATLRDYYAKAITREREMATKFNNAYWENLQLKELLNEIDKVYSSGVSRSDIEEDEYVIYHYTFKKLDELFNKWEKMKND